MAASSVRDIIVKDDDLVAATHGRGFWILDDITPLRQIDAATRDAGRRAVQAADGVARALEHEHRHAAAARRADGAESAGGRDHQLLPEAAASGPVTLEIAARRTDAWCGATRAPIPSRRFPIRPTAPVPLYWYRPPQVLSTAAGMHRFTWDVHYQPLAGGGGGGRGGLADRGGPVQHRAGADDAVGVTRAPTR